MTAQSPHKQRKTEVEQRIQEHTRRILHEQHVRNPALYALRKRVVRLLAHARQPLSKKDIAAGLGIEYQFASRAVDWCGWFKAGGGKVMLTDEGWQEHNNGGNG